MLAEHRGSMQKLGFFILSFVPGSLQKKLEQILEHEVMEVNREGQKEVVPNESN